jgi:hypothetical protein
VINTGTKSLREWKYRTSEYFPLLEVKSNRKEINKINETRITFERCNTVFWFHCHVNQNALFREYHERNPSVKSVNKH